MEEMSVTEFDREIGELELPELTIFKPEDSVFDVIQYFSKSLNGLVGIETDGKLTGVVTEWDVIHQFSPDIDPKDVKVADLMVDHPVILYKENTFYEVMKVIAGRNFRAFPVCDDEGKAKYIFNTQVLFKFLVSYFPKILEGLGTLESWEPTKSIQAFSEGFSYSSTINDDSSLHESYFLTAFDRIPSAKLLKADVSISLRDAWKIMVDGKSENLILTKHETEIAGIVTIRDLITKILINDGESDLSMSIGVVMTSDPHCLMYKHAIGYGINHFFKYHYKHMVIVDEDRVPLKVVSLLEIFSHLIGKIKLN